MIDILDRLFSKLIRLGGKCKKCGRKENLQCAHIHSRRNFNTRWDEDNAVALCCYHHLFWAHKEPVQFSEWVKERMGEKRYNDLRIRANTPVKGQDLHLVEIYLRMRIGSEKTKQDYKYLK